MANWILALPREDMEHCVKIGTFGLKRKYVLGRVSVGDGVVCYVTKEYKVIAIGEVTSPYYMDDSSIFRTAGLFPDRFDFRATQIKPELDFMTVIDKLEFIKNLAYWSAYFKNGIVEISDKDFKTIASAAHVKERAAGV